MTGKARVCLCDFPHGTPHLTTDHARRGVMTPNADYVLADEIADGMRQRVVETIQRTGKALCGVVFSTADVLWLLDAYDEVRGRKSTQIGSGAS